ncbi:hypothetical protein JCM10908_006447 [Rhodotorula pacifica]|uniref:beta-fructofuranosidase SUC2 n=1 Tax=Rhodotorula pacifica TaxID=1495444 RepID=UPI0031787602
MKFTLLDVVVAAAAVANAQAAPAASSVAGPVTTGIISALSQLSSNAGGASAVSSVFAGGVPTRSFATSVSFPSASGPSSVLSSMSMSGNATRVSSALASASSTATGIIGGGGAGANSTGTSNSTSSTCAPTAVPASATQLPTSAPNGTVITGDYTGNYRPQVHFSPPRGFMNDPNGLHRDTNGTYHLYYQYNPLQYVAGNQHWGHATSKDLYHWTNQPIAIFPPNATTQVFSGSAVLDPNNTSGFFTANSSSNSSSTTGVVAVYTLNTPTSQVQEVAYSTDGGYTFTPYANNPVLDLGSSQFRDPQVFWYQDHWVMTVSLANDYTIQFYTSPNLTSWTFASNFTHHGLLGLAYECPNLVRVPYQNDTSQSAWLLYISINPGAPLGGSVGQYFPGEFNGTHFVPFDGAARIADFAKDNYASQWFADTQAGEAISIGWASNWQYTQSVPTAQQGFRSAMSLPRRNYLTNITRLGWDLVSLPYDLSPVVGPSLLPSNNATTNANSTVSVDFGNITSKAVWFSLNVTLPQAAITNASLISAAASINITFAASNSSSCSSSSGNNSSSSSSSSNSGPAAVLTYFYAGLTNGALSLARPAASSSWGAANPFFTDKFSYTLVDPLTSLVGVFDRSMLEVFVNNGAHSATMLLYPDQPVGSMQVATGGLPAGTTLNLQVNGLNSTWQSS